MCCIVSTSKVKPFRLIEVPNTKPTIDVVTIEGSIFRVTTAPDTLAQEYALVLPGTENGTRTTRYAVRPHRPSPIGSLVPLPNAPRAAPQRDRYAQEELELYERAGRLPMHMSYVPSPAQHGRGLGGLGVPRCP